MSDNPAGTGDISMNDAISLLSNPPTDNATEERTETQEASQQPEAEAPQVETDHVDETPEDDHVDDDASEGEEDYDDDEYDADEEEPQATYTVKVDGEEVEVDLDELRNGYQRQQSFTRKSMELAEQRKAFEAEAAQTKQARDYYAQQLDQLSAQIQQTTEQEPDWRALAETMSERDLFLAKAEYDQYKEQQKNVDAERQRVAHEQAVDREKELKKHLHTQRADMLNRIPSWQNDETRESERQEIIKYAQRRIGFSQEEIENASDARAIELLYKAWKWDNLQLKKPAAKKKARQAPKMAKAGRPKTKREVASRSRQEAKKRFENAGTVDAAVEFLMGR
tara:strand:+ start:12657 stop:13670 length:1014 start_codon:yes stop_codon:yes gene_type:complete